METVRVVEHWIVTPLSGPTTERRHVESPDCWCNPVVQQFCDDCDGDGCWKCEDGMTDVGDENRPVIYIHVDPSKDLERH